MIRIVEVGPRDGLQNEAASVPTEAKAAFVDALSATGVSEVEVTAFVSPRRIPQLADADDLFRRIRRRQGVVYSALVPNEQGLERALRAGVDKISVFTSASETFNRRNIQTSVAGSIRRFLPVLRRAGEAGIRTRGYVSAAFWCAYEGAVSPDAVLDVVGRLADLGVEEISVADTIGRAVPDEVRRLLDRLLAVWPADRTAVHFHDTHGRGRANVLASLALGVTAFDASAGGIGGCPNAPGATGNVATEAVVEALREAGETVAVDVGGLHRARRLLDPFLAGDRAGPPCDDPAACASCEMAEGGRVCPRRAGGRMQASSGGAS